MSSGVGGLSPSLAGICGPGPGTGPGPGPSTYIASEANRESPGFCYLCSQQRCRRRISTSAREKGRPYEPARPTLLMFASEKTDRQTQRERARETKKQKACFEFSKHLAQETLDCYISIQSIPTNEPESLLFDPTVRPTVLAAESRQTHHFFLFFARVASSSSVLSVRFPFPLSPTPNTSYHFVPIMH